MKRWLTGVLSVCLVLVSVGPVGVLAESDVTVKEAVSALATHLYQADYLDGDLAVDVDVAFDGGREGVQGEFEGQVAMQWEPFFAVTLDSSFDGRSFSTWNNESIDFAGMFDLLLSHGQLFFAYDLEAPEVTSQDWESLDWLMPVAQRWSRADSEMDAWLADLVDGPVYDYLEPQLSLTEAAEGDGYLMALQLFETDEEVDELFTLMDDKLGDSGMMRLVDGRLLIMVLQLLQLSDLEVSIELELTQDFFPERLLVEVTDGLEESAMAQVESDSQADEEDVEPYQGNNPSIIGDMSLSFTLTEPEASSVEIPETLMDRYSGLSYEKLYERLKALMDLAVEARDADGASGAADAADDVDDYGLGLGLEDFDALFGPAMSDSGYFRVYAAPFQDFAFDLNVYGSGQSDNVSDFTANLSERENLASGDLSSGQRLALLQAVVASPTTSPTFEELDENFQDYHVMAYPYEISFNRASEGWTFAWDTKELMGYRVFSDQLMDRADLALTEAEIEALLADDATVLNDVMAAFGEDWQGALTLQDGAEEENQMHFSWRYYTDRPAGWITVTTDDSLKILDYQLSGFSLD